MCYTQLSSGKTVVALVATGLFVLSATTESAEYSTINGCASAEPTHAFVAETDVWDNPMSNTEASSTPEWDEEYEPWCGECECERKFRLTEFNIYPTFSYLGSASASYNEFEFASITDLGCWEVENRTVLNVADLPSSISLGPTNPFGDPTVVGVRAAGFGDVLSGFFFSQKKEGHERPWHLGIGPVFTFPSATDDILGAGKWTVGPGAHFSTEIGEKLTFGFFVWQSWTYAGDDSRKDVNQLFGKPFLLYELNEKWELVYIPLGLSYSWKAQGNKGTVPLGGGVRRLFEVHGQKMGFQVQVFDYVIRKSKDPEWEVRMTIEFLFDE